MVLAVTATALAGCGDDDDEGGTSAAPAADSTAAKPESGGDEILIKTSVRVAPGGGGSGVVLPGSVIGDKEFCPGGKFTDRHGEPPEGLVVKEIRCPDGTLTVTFSPTQDSHVQSSAWSVVSGTGAYKSFSLRGDEGRMTARFSEDDGSKGNETFKGTTGP